MIQFILIGIITGITIGLVGIGAGVIMIPLLIYNGMTIKQAVASGLVLQLVPQSIFGVIEYYKAGDVKIYETVMIIIGSTLGIYLGAILSTRNYINERNIYLLLSIILVVTGIYIFFKYYINQNYTKKK
jgi:uncharacterized membrane protein YfcA